MNFLKRVKFKEMKLKQEHLETDEYLYYIFSKNKILKKMRNIKVLIQNIDLEKFIDKLEESLIKSRIITQETDKETIRSDSPGPKTGTTKSRMTRKEKGSFHMSQKQRNDTVNRRNNKTIRFRNTNDTKSVLDPIFSSPKEFMDVYEEIRQSSLKMLEEMIYVQNSIQTLKKKKDLVEDEGKRIEKLQKYLLAEKEKKWLDLDQRKKLYLKQKEEIIKTFIFIKKDEFFRKSQASLRRRERKKNKNKIHKFAYEEVKNKLINSIDYLTNAHYPGIDSNSLELLIRKKDFDTYKTMVVDQSNKEDVFPICLKLLKVMELLLKHIFDKNVEYDKDPKLSVVKESLFKKLKNRKKIEKSKNAKIEMENKRREEIEEIIEKGKKSYFLQHNRVGLIYIKPPWKRSNSDEKKKKKEISEEKRPIFERLYEYLSDSEEK